MKQRKCINIIYSYALTGFILGMKPLLSLLKCVFGLNCKRKTKKKTQTPSYHTQHYHPLLDTTLPSYPTTPNTILPLLPTLQSPTLAPSKWM